MEGFKNRDIIAHFAQIPRAGKAGRPGTDNGNLVAVGCRNFDRRLIFLCIVVISYKTLQAANGNTLALFATDAFALALFFLWADTPAYSRERIRGSEDVIGGIKVFLDDLRNKFRNAHRNRAACSAERVRATQATLCFGNCQFFRIAESYFFKVTGTDHRILLGHGVFRQTHISH